MESFLSNSSLDKFVQIQNKYPTTAVEINNAVIEFETSLCDKKNNIQKRQEVSKFAEEQTNFYYRHTIGFQGSWN